MEAIISRLDVIIKAVISRSVGEQKKKELDPEISKCFDLAKTESRQGQQGQGSSCPHQAVTNIKPEDVEKTFGISVDSTGGNWTLSAKDRIAIPQHLDLRDIDLVTKGAPLNEAHTRARIDAVLFSTLAAAKREERSNQNRMSSSSTQPVRSVHLQFEKDMKMEWNFPNKQRWLVTGRTDYSLWYGEPGQMEANLVVCKAKRKGVIGMEQTLIYMAMLHQARRAAGRHDTAIYGVATDSNIWEFIRLGNDSKYSVAHYRWDHGHGIQILSTLRLIINHASGLTGGGAALGRKRTLSQASGIEFRSSR
ncbi:uncharacterized protein BO88DRAFT_427590 [Aspergillus vadensis CBS 113365]|uniref:Fungal-type protein kinase domain-containing protein n=1 Tax=Aspergillus vadensis (strain CBS 113365 / IMI 142717 / IBT 24658) TaxID=1448311 RepID=A0A319B2N7_ASPVC|nr:hypothetical protein BO88DRAFT_427590 [Aspergillus vadensis CBS 113365]PYH66996.1 hypothetical protein BO88DRAFT_427590 [Aspergillus vadensis CBS 113365]